MRYGQIANLDGLRAIIKFRLKFPKLFKPDGWADRRTKGNPISPFRNKVVTGDKKNGAFTCYLVKYYFDLYYFLRYELFSTTFGLVQTTNRRTDKFVQMD